MKYHVEISQMVLKSAALKHGLFLRILKSMFANIPTQSFSAKLSDIILELPV